MAATGYVMFIPLRITKSLHGFAMCGFNLCRLRGRERLPPLPHFALPEKCPATL
jgi:hypothetical protein